MSFLDAIGGADNFSLSAFVAFIILLVLTGQLVPGSTHRRALKDKDDQISEWRKTHVADLERNREQAMQITRLLEASRTTTHLIHSMHQEVTRDVEILAMETRANADSQLYQDQSVPVQPAAPAALPAANSQADNSQQTPRRTRRQPRDRANRNGRRDAGANGTDVDNDTE